MRQFVIVDKNGERWPFDGERYSWSWGLAAGSIDRMDDSRVEVWKAPTDPDSDSELVVIILQPTAVVLDADKVDFE